MLDVITHPCLASTNVIMAWMINHIPLFYVDVIIHPCPSPNAGLANLCKGGPRSLIVKVITCGWKDHKIFTYNMTINKNVSQTLYWQKTHHTSALIHWGRVTHICIDNLTVIGSDYGLSPGRHQAIIWTIAGTLLIGPVGTNFNEILIEIHTFSLKKMQLKMSSEKWRPFCLSLNVLMWQL